MSETHGRNVRVEVSDFVEATFTPRYLFHVRRRVGEKQATPKQAISAKSKYLEILP